MGEEVPLLDRDNQSKNPSVINKMDGANDANDTPVLVEAEAKSDEREVGNTEENVVIISDSSLSA